MPEDDPIFALFGAVHICQHLNFHPFINLLMEGLFDADILIELQGIAVKPEVFCLIQPQDVPLGAEDAVHMVVENGVAADIGDGFNAGLATGTAGTALGSGQPALLLQPVITVICQLFVFDIIRLQQECLAVIFQRTGPATLLVKFIPFFLTGPGNVGNAFQGLGMGMVIA